eukprot:m.178543 g.178543  ORF g.178543 m.178543 type:complete len:618 (+) comp15470_c0_seq1:330-2183(+)
MTDKASASTSLGQKIREWAGLKPVVARPIWSQPLQSIVDQLSVNNELSIRVQCLQNLSSDFLPPTTLDNMTIESLWKSVRDLLQLDRSTRHLTMTFLQQLLEAKRDELTPLNRTSIFEALRAQELGEDSSLVLDVLSALTRGGAELGFLEKHIGAFIQDLLPACLTQKSLVKMLHLLEGIFTHHFALLDPSSTHDLILLVCHLCLKSCEMEDIQAGLAVLRALITEKNVNQEYLTNIVLALSTTIMIDQFHGQCMELFQSLLRVSLVIEYATVATLTKLIEDKRNPDNLTRGCVYLISHMSWGTLVAVSPPSPIYIIPSFLQATTFGHNNVTTDILFSLNMLILRKRSELSSPIWDLIMDVWQTALELTHDSDSEPPEGLRRAIEDVLNSMEKCFSEDEFEGDVDRLFDLIEASPGDRDMTIALNYKAQNLHPSISGWLDNLADMMLRYFKEEYREEIKMRVLQVLEDVLASCIQMKQVEDLKVVVSFFGGLDAETPNVLDATVKLLVKVGMVSSGTFLSTVCDILVTIVKYLYIKSPGTSGGPLRKSPLRRSSSMEPPRQTVSIDLKNEAIPVGLNRCQPVADALITLFFSPPSTLSRGQRHLCFTKTCSSDAIVT